MNLDKRAFLAFATMIATASAAACSAEPNDGAAAQDLASSSNGDGDETRACVSDDETAYPYQEGTCSKLFGRATEEDYAMWTTPGADGKTPAEREGCQPWSYAHPAGASENPCPNLAANALYDRCHGYAIGLKKTAAGNAVACLERLSKLTDKSGAMACGFDALDKSCPSHPTAEATCRELANKLVDAEKSACVRWLSGIRAEGRERLLLVANEGEWRGLREAVESVIHSPIR